MSLSNSVLQLSQTFYLSLHHSSSKLAFESIKRAFRLRLLLLQTLDLSASYLRSTHQFKEMKATLTSKESYNEGGSLR